MMIPRSMMRSIVLGLTLLAACQPAETGQRLGKKEQRFTSGEAFLLDFEFDGRLSVGTPGAFDARKLIETQLMYTVGQLYADRAVGRIERLEVSNIVVKDMFLLGSEVTYHAKLPVAWGSQPTPTSYTLTLPSRVEEEDQVRFFEKYGQTCAAEETGAVGPETMFLYNRPREEGCTFEANDVVTADATIEPSTENTTGKYPEYDRIWDDGALKVVMMFTRAQEDPRVVDEGSDAYDEFVRKMGDYLRSIQPSKSDRAFVATSGTAPTANLRATLPDGRTITVDAMLVAAQLSVSENFDSWYDALTPAADLILFNGHARLGENVRVLMEKGTFQPRQYVIWAANGCDTLAYVNRTLADRRALLNPDDPLGTKYMDTVSNVMAGYFADTPATSMTLIDAVVAAGGRSQAERRAAKTYQQIFASIDPEQLIAVTGEEDNEFNPDSPPPATAVTPVPDAHGRFAEAPPFAGVASGNVQDGKSCSAGGRPADGTARMSLFYVVGFILVAARRLRREP